jgi:hypothetical protein
MLMTFCACLWSATPASGACTPNVGSLTSAAIQSRIDSASNGGTVCLPSGSGTLTSNLRIPDTKGITIEGQGVDVTILIDGSSTQGTISLNVAAGNALSRLTNLTIDANNSFDAGSGAQVEVRACGLDTFRIDHIKIKNVRQRGIIVTSNKGCEYGGLIDHFTCESGASASQHCIDPQGACCGLDSVPFSRGVTLGTNRALYIEDSTFTYTADTGDGVLDAYSGARFVFRFNKITNSDIGWHGADSGPRGIHSMEVYHNTFSNSLGKIVLAHLRSGVGFLFGNAATGNLTSIDLSIYRVNTAGGVGGDRCNGSSSWDGNQGSGLNPGWPCLDQPGHVFTQNPGGSHSKYGLYFWSNLVNGSAPTINPAQTGNGPYLVSDRDYWKQVPSFTGTTGIGVGTLASRPATCTTGVAYWATDQGEWNSKNSGPDGELYKCTATNTWMLHYRPYLYPHPLQTAAGGTISPPAAPHDVRIIR